MNRVTLVIAAVLLVAVAVVVGQAASGASDSGQAASRAPLVIYSGRSEAMVGDLLARFEAETGIRVSVRYNGTAQLTTQLMAEGRQTPADVVFLQESGYLAALASAGALAPLPEPLLAPVPQRFRDQEGRWVGTSGRARVLVYNTESVDAAELPHSLADLADPRWQGRLGWAPANSSFQAHVSALLHMWGEAKTREWLEGVKANAPRVYPRNATQVLAAASGEIDVGWVNHYYLHQLNGSGRERVANASFAEPSDSGNLLMLAGVGISSHSRRQEDARVLVAWLVAEEAQAYFAHENYEYPVIENVATHHEVPPLESLNLANIEQAWLTDVGPTLALLRDVGLL